jgi:hypothetical protein
MDLYSTGSATEFMRQLTKHKEHRSRSDGRSVNIWMRSASGKPVKVGEMIFAIMIVLASPKCGGASFRGAK